MDSLLQWEASKTLLLTELLTTHHYSFVLTSRFKQDALENFFSQIRSKGGNRDNPSTSEYEAACKNVAVIWFLQTNSKNSNCKMDLDQFLGLMSSRKVIDPVVPPGDLTTDTTNKEFHPSDPNSDRINSATLDWTSIYTLSDIGTNVVAYIAGYLSRHTIGLTGCTACETARKQSFTFSSSMSSNVESSSIFMILKTYDWAKHGLIIPSPQLLVLCTTTFGDDFQAGNWISVTQIRTNGDDDMPHWRCCRFDEFRFGHNITCQEHKRFTLSFMIKLFVLLCIHHYVRIRNRELKESGSSRKNRKADKIMHK